MLGNAVFFSCTRLESVTLSKNLVSIGKACFYNCSKLKTITLPGSLKNLGSYIFGDCTSLNSVVINNGPTYISREMFLNCYKLKKVTLPNSVDKIYRKSFIGCFEISDLHISNNITALNKNVFNDCSNVKNLTIPDSVKKIYTGALGGYSKETFNVPKNVTGISPTAFGQINQIKNFTVDSENNYYSTVDGILYSKDKKIFKIYPQARKDKSFTIPTGTEEIGSKSFYSIESLKDITIPTTVKQMYDYAIFFVQGIQSITVPSSVKSIGKYAMGYGNGEYGVSMTAFDLAIIGSKNSQANKYAKTNSISFFTGTPKQNVTSKSLVGGKSFIVKVANINQSDLTFTSSNEKIATVDKNGRVTGIRKGTTNIITTSITKNFIYKITVTSNAKNKPKTFDDSSYYKITAKNYETWTKDYYKFNNTIKYSGIDNPNIKCYTSNDYICLHALAGSKKHIIQAKEELCDDYDQYIYFLYGTNMELSRFKLHKNTVFYRGSSDVSNITGTSYTLKDMKKAIGRTYTDKTLVSASINHGVAVNFSDDNKGAVLEIYAPKHIAVCGYIERISEFSSEQEMLFAANTKFKVIDAGVRKVTYDNLTIGEKETKTERFMKLLVVK